jgi:hypothetical protein
VTPDLETARRFVKSSREHKKEEGQSLTMTPWSAVIAATAADGLREDVLMVRALVNE